MTLEEIWGNDQDDQDVSEECRESEEEMPVNDVGVGFFTLEKGMCKWPLNDPVPFDNFRMCGDPVRAQLCPYCETHEKMAYNPEGSRREVDGYIRQFARAHGGARSDKSEVARARAGFPQDGAWV